MDFAIRLAEGEVSNEEGLARCHQSCIVNLRQIDQYNPYRGHYEDCHCSYPFIRGVNS